MRENNTQTIVTKIPVGLPRTVEHRKLRALADHHGAQTSDYIPDERYDCYLWFETPVLNYAGSVPRLVLADNSRAPSSTVVDYCTFYKEVEEYFSSPRSKCKAVELSGSKVAVRKSADLIRVENSDGTGLVYLTPSDIFELYTIVE